MRLRSALAVAPLLTALACADAPSPTATSADAAADVRAASTRACLPAAVVGSLTSLYPAPARGAALQRFQQARVLATLGEMDAGWAGLVTLAGDVLDRAVAGTLLDPRGPATTAEAAAALVDQLYACGGRDPVGDVIGEILENGVDVAITTVAPDRPTRLVVPSANFGLVDDEGGFFDEPALLIVERVPDGPPFLPQRYTEYPPRFRASVLPASAQANFGRTPVAGDPTILVIICPANPHPDLDDLTILRVPDAFPAEPAQLLDAQHVHDPDVTCTDAGAYPAGRVGAGASLGGRVFGALRRGAASALDWLAPQPLYAVDGGIGGRTFSLSSFVAVAQPREEPTPGDVVVLNDVNVLDNLGMRNQDNRRLARNLVTPDGDGPRAAATRVVFDRGRDAPCFVLLYEACRDAQQTALVAEITELGLSVTRHDDVRSYAEVPEDVRVIFLFNPRVAFTAADVAGLRSFVVEGGRIVLIGEHAAFYDAVGLQVENDLLAGLGSGLRAVAAQIDCTRDAAPVALPASSIQPHQTTAGIGSLSVSCMGAIAPADGDVVTLRSTDGTRIVGGVTTIGAPPVVASRAAAAARPLLRRERVPPTPASPPAPRVGSRGQPTVDR